MRDSPEAVIAAFAANGMHPVSVTACRPIGEPDVGANATGKWERFTGAKQRKLRQPKTQSESDFLRQVLDYAKLRQWRSAHFRPGLNRRGEWQTAVAGDGKGFFDLILVRDRLIAAELKVGYRKLTPEQDQWFAAYKRAGVECYVWWETQWNEIERVLA